jgi:outer membrane protein, heavy metal efflux system
MCVGRKFAVLLASLSALSSFGDPLTIKQAIETAQGKNPDIRSLEHQVSSMEAQARQALAPSEPSLSLYYNDMPSLLNPRQSASTVYQIAQPIAFPGKAFVNSAALRNQSKALYDQLRSKRLSVSVTVRSAYYNLALTRKNLELNLDQKNSFERILEIAKRRYASGSITEVDLMTAQSSLYSNLNDLRNLEATERATLAQLNLLLVNPPDQPIEIEPLKMETLKPFEKEETLSKMLSQQPEIQAATHTMMAADKNLTAAWMTLLPDFEVFGGVNYYNLPGASPVIFSNNSSINQTYMVGVSVTIPIWAIFDQREGIDSATHNRAAAEAAVDSQKLQSKTTLESTLQQLWVASENIKNYEKHLLPLAEQTLNLAMINYGSGKIDFQALSDSATNWRSTKTAYYSLVASYLTTYYSVGQLIGEEL